MDREEDDSEEFDEFDEEFEEFDDDFDEDEDDDDDEDDDEFEETDQEESIEAESDSSEEPQKEAIQAKMSQPEPLISPGEIPLQIRVEVGQLNMSVQKLKELQPGNTLDLHVQPENGVDLTVNGRRIAKAELMKVGETLGVRILEIG